MWLYIFSDYEYFLTDKNHLCGDYENIGAHILQPQTCKEASIDIKTKVLNANLKPMKTENVSDSPKGCYLWNERHVYFNEHPIGSRDHTSRQICERQGKTTVYSSIVFIKLHRNGNLRIKSSM